MAIYFLTDTQTTPEGAAGATQGHFSRSDLEAALWHSGIHSTSPGTWPSAWASQSSAACTMHFLRLETTLHQMWRWASSPSPPITITLVARFAGAASCAPCPGASTANTYKKTIGSSIALQSGLQSGHLRCYPLTQQAPGLQVTRKHLCSGSV